MRRIGTLVLAAALCATAFTAGTAYGGAAEGSWFISPRVNALWLDDGRVAESGTFQELMSRPGIFRQLATQAGLS